MGFGFSVKLAPGVRVRASSKGLRTSVGPRAARVHVGGGRTAISSSVGPLIWSGTVGGKRRRTPNRRATTPPSGTSAGAELTAEPVAEVTRKLEDAATRKLEEVRVKYGAAEVDAYGRILRRVLIALAVSVIVTVLFAPAVLVVIAVLLWMIVVAAQEIRRRRVIDRVTRTLK